MNLDDMERNHNDDNNHAENTNFTAEQSRSNGDNDATTANDASKAVTTREGDREYYETESS